MPRDNVTSNPATSASSTTSAAAAAALVRLEKSRKHLVCAPRDRFVTQDGVGSKAAVAHRQRGTLEFFLQDPGRGAVDGPAQVVGGLEGVLDAHEVALVALFCFFVCVEEVRRFLRGKKVSLFFFFAVSLALSFSLFPFPSPSLFSFIKKNAPPSSSSPSAPWSATLPS